MGKDDSIDRDRLAQFAWRAPLSDDDVGQDGADPGADPEAEVEAGAGGSPGLDWSPEGIERSVRQAAALAAEVEPVWDMAPGPAQAEATAPLVAALADLGFGAPALMYAPREGVQLARLLLRYADQLDEGDVSGAAMALAFACVAEAPEAVDLLVEAAGHPHSELVFAVHSAALRHAEEAELPGLGARLVSLLEEGSPLARHRAAAWLRDRSWPEAAPALRRGLREPDLTLRAECLETLLAHEPTALTAEDVAWLVDDAVAHPTTVRREHPDDLDLCMRYDELLTQAVGRIRPAGGHEPLLRILAGDCAYVNRCRDGLDRDFALAALMAGYPEQGLPALDRWMHHESTMRRFWAVQAAAHLSPDLARPWLLAALADPASFVVREARRAWEDLYGAPPDRLPPAALPPALGGAPRPDVPPERLADLREGERGERREVLAALTSEAPSTQTLALIVYALGDSELLRAHADTPGLPKDRKAWAEWLVERFGPAGFDGLLWLAERYLGDGYDGWVLAALHAVKTAAPEALGPDAGPRLRDLAVRLIANGDGGAYEQEALEVLVELGSPSALVDRLWAMFEADSRGWRDFWLLRLLESFVDHPLLVQAVPRAFHEALDAGDHARAGRVADLGARLGLPAVADRVRELLSAPSGLELDLAEELGTAIAQLYGDGAVSGALLGEALAHPDQPRFFAALDALTWPEAVEHWRPALEAALDSPAFGGRAACTAAAGLAFTKILSDDDPRLGPLLSRAAPRDRIQLVQAVLWIYRRLGNLRGVVEEGLLDPDPEVCDEYVTALVGANISGHEELLAALYPRIECPECRRRVALSAGIPDPDEPFWRPPPEEREGHALVRMARRISHQACGPREGEN